MIKGVATRAFNSLNTFTHLKPKYLYTYKIRKASRSISTSQYFNNVTILN